MKLAVLGGPNDGASAVVHDDIPEGQKYVLDGAEYFIHWIKGSGPKLIYYKSSLEA